jgi:hypothetical protein
MPAAVPVGAAVGGDEALKGRIGPGLQDIFAEVMSLLAFLQ